MLYTLAGGGEEIVTIAVTGGLFIAVLSIILGTVKTVVTNKQREQTKREVAAYIAEGTMSPEEGERIINAGGGTPGKKCC